MTWVITWGPGWSLLLGLLLEAAHAVQAQHLPAGDGLRGDYYNGSNFDEFVLNRRDATVAFDWAHQPPAPGVTAEYFSVRWTGWLVPPASGRYTFQATVDDGMRIWLNGRLILNEWRPQSVRRFATSVELKAGEPYQLRVEYFQDILDTRATLTWERPDVPLAPPPASWRNLWGLNTAPPGPEAIPTRYLFSRDPRPSSARPLPPPAVAQAPPPLPPPAAAKKPTPRPRRRPASAPTAVAPVAAPTLITSDSGSTAQLDRLRVGEALTLPELYFEQSQARLLPAARTALDALAAALRSQPTLRFEVQGHTDNVGNAELNRQLSQQRAEAVCLYLVAHGVAAGQLHPQGYGGSQPVADNADPAQRPRNRRVVLLRH